VAVLRTFNELTFIVLAWTLFKKARFVAERSCVRKESVLIFIVLRAGAVREFVREITEPPRRTVLIAKLLRFVVLTPGTVRVFDKLIVEPISEDTTRLVALISLARIKFVLISPACKKLLTKAVLVNMELV
jgi:hypothetical protein